MHFVLQAPSLQHISLIKIVAALWNQRDIFIQIEELSTPLPPDDHEGRGNQVWKKWMVIEENVKSNVSTLVLPQLCRKDLLRFVKPLGMEMVYWCHYRSGRTNGTYEFLDIVLPQKLCWTMHGTVDYGKTAKFMVKEERVDVERRYELACINCLEDEARQLFESMGEDRKREYVNGLLNRRNGLRHQYSTVYFTCTLSGDVEQLNSYFRLGHWRASDINECLFQCSLLSGDGSTCEYWFEKLNQEKKAQFLDEKRMLRMSCDRSHTSKLLYYLSRMNEEQRERLFRECTYDVLTCLLRWPLQTLFMEAVKCAWRFVNKEMFMQVLDSITRHIGSGFQNYYDIYPRLFWEFWRLGPLRLKHYFLDNSIQFEHFLISNGEEFIRSIVDETLSHQMEELLYDRTGRISQVFLKERAISEAALREWKETAALNSENDPRDKEKRLKSERLSRFVGLVIQGRMDRRRNGGSVWKIVYSP